MQLRLRRHSISVMPMPAESSSSTNTSSSSSSSSRSIASSFLLTTLVTLACLCLFGIVGVSGSHFQFGTITWVRTSPPTVTNVPDYEYTFSMISGWRQCYQPFIDANNGRCPTIGNIVNVGSLFFFPGSNQPDWESGTEITDWFNYGQRPPPPTKNVPRSAADRANKIPNTAFRANVLVQQLQASADDPGSDWFVGTNTVKIKLGQVNSNLAPGGLNTLTLPFILMFMQCCRISTLLDGNNDRLAFMGTLVNGDKAINSPVTTSRIREYAYVNVPIVYSVPGTQLQKNALRYSFSPTTSAGLQSQLLRDFPSNRISNYNNGQPNVDPITGKLTWTPTRLGLVVMQFSIKDTVTGSIIVLDIVFQVIDAANAPEFITPIPGYDFAVAQNPGQFPGFNFPYGFSRTINIRAQDSDKNKQNRGINDMSTTITPEGITFSFTPNRNDPNGIGTGQLTYTAKLGSEDINVCFSCHNFIGLPSVKQYCITLIPGGKVILATGILRDFHRKRINDARNPLLNDPALANLPDFDIGQNKDTTTYVTDNLNENALPTFKGGGDITATSYVDWWKTDPRYADLTLTTPQQQIQLRNREQVNTIVLTSGVTTDQRIYTFRSENFNPLDGQLFGNELDDNNYFFTYEIHTSIDYKGGEVLEFWSSDDLFVYFDSVLEVKLPGTGNGSIKKQTIRLDDTAMGKKKLYGTYRCDIFYAHRSRANKPVIQIQIPDASLCDALAGQSSGVAIDASTTGLVVGGSSTRFSSDNMRLLGKATLVNGDIQLSSPSNANSVGAALYALRGVATGVRLLYGFLAEFQFTMTGPAQGFAFVMHNDQFGSERTGEAASNLGYDGLTNSLAIEFDANYDSGLGDPNYQHISIHTRYPSPNDPLPPANTANEAASFGISGTPVDDGTKLDFTNGTVHYVKIQYVPASVSASSTCPKAGVIRVYVGNLVSNGVIRYVLFPQATASIDGCQLAKMWPSGAPFVGFTSSTGATVTGDVRIKKFKLSIVKTDPSRATTVVAPTDIIAGQTGTFTVQARDACGNLITTGGETGIKVDMSYVPNSSKNDFPFNTANVTIAPVKDNGDGTYTVSYTSTYAGGYQLSMYFSGSSTPVGGKPWPVNVRPDITDRMKSNVQLGNSLSQDKDILAVGNTAIVQIIARDQYRNLQDRQSDVFQVSYQPTAATSTPPVFDTTPNVFGRYIATFKPDRSGLFYVSVQLGGNSADQVSRSPLPITVVPGLADADKSKAGSVIAGMSAATAGQETSFTLELRDGADNAIITERKEPILVNGVNIPLDVICPSGTGVTGACTLSYTPVPNPLVTPTPYSVPLTCAWTTNTPSQFRCTYKAFKAGVYSWSNQLLMNGRFVPAATLGSTLTVAPGPVAASTSGLAIGGRVIPAGVGTDLAIQARDQYFNDRTTPNEPIRDATTDAFIRDSLFYVMIKDGPANFGPVYINDPNNVKPIAVNTDVPVNYAGSGQYVFNFKATTKGKYTLVIKLDTPDKGIITCGEEILYTATGVTIHAPKGGTTTAPAGNSGTLGTPGSAIVTVAFGPAATPSKIRADLSSAQSGMPSTGPVTSQYPPIISSSGRITVGTSPSLVKFVIQSIDANNNERYDPSTPVIDPNDYIPDITLNDRDGGSQKIPITNPPSTDNFGGVTLTPPQASANIGGAFWAKRAGLYTLSATLVANGAAITQQPTYQVVLSPDAAVKATAAGPGRSGGPAGKYVQFTLTLVDQYQNVRDVEDLDLTVEISNAVDKLAPTDATPSRNQNLQASTAATTPIPTNQGVLRSRSAAYPLVGSYLVQYLVPGVVGQFFRITAKRGNNVLATLDCTVVADGQSINGFMDIQQPVFVAQEALLKMYECKQGIKTPSSTCEVVTPPGGAFDIELYQTDNGLASGVKTNVLTGAQVTSEPQPSSVEPNAYYTRFTVNKPGTWFAMATRNSIPALTSPQSFVVLPGIVDPNQSTVVLSPTTIFAGQAVTATVTLRDSLGNVIRNKEIATLASQANITPILYGVVAFFRKGSTIVTVNTTISDDQTGIFTLVTSTSDTSDQTIKIAGSGDSAYAVTVAYYVQGAPIDNSQPLAASPYSLSVFPSAPAPALSSFSPSLLTLTFEVSKPVTITVALADRFGNLVTNTNPTLVTEYAKSLTCHEYVSGEMNAPVKSDGGSCTGGFQVGQAGYFFTTFTAKGSGNIFIGTKLGFTPKGDGSNEGTAFQDPTTGIHIGNGNGAIGGAALPDGSRSPAQVLVAKGPLSSWNSELWDSNPPPPTPGTPTSAPAKQWVITSDTSLTMIAGQDFTFYFYAYDTSGVDAQGRKSPWRSGPGLLSGYVELNGDSTDTTLDQDKRKIQKRVDLIVTSEANARYRITVPASAIQVANVNSQGSNGVTNARYTLHFLSLGLEYTAYASTSTGYANTALKNPTTQNPLTQAEADRTPETINSRIIVPIPFSVKPGPIDFRRTLIQPDGGGIIRPIKVSTDNPDSASNPPTDTVGSITIQFHDAGGNQIRMPAGTLSTTTFQDHLDPVRNPRSTFNFKTVFLAARIECPIDGDSSRPRLNGTTLPNPNPIFKSTDGIKWTSTHSSQSVGLMTLFLFSTATATDDYVERGPDSSVSLLPCSLQQSLIQPVTPGFPYYATSYAIGSQDVVAGEIVDYTIYTRDRFNNRLTDSSIMSGNAAVIKISAQVTFNTTASTGEQTMTQENAWIVPQFDLRNQSIPSIINNGDGTYRFQIRPTRAGRVRLFISFDNQPAENKVAGNVLRIFPIGTFIDLGSGIPTDFPPLTKPEFIVTPGPPASFVPLPQLSTLTLRAGIPFSFMLQVTDQFENSIFTNDHTFIITLRSITPQVAYQTRLIPEDAGPGLMKVAFTNTWHNAFQMSIQLNLTRFDATVPQPTFCPSNIPFRCVLGGCRASEVECKNPPIPTPRIFPLNFLHATCGYDEYLDQKGVAISLPGVGKDKPYRCHPEETCVAQYSSCPTKPSDGAIGAGTCPYGSSAQFCPNSGGHCVGIVSGDSCPIPASCPVFAPIACSRGGCRSSRDLCPSDYVCPPTFVLCPDRATCAATLAECTDVHTRSKNATTANTPTTPNTPGAGWNTGGIYTPCEAGTYRCRDGRCLARAGDCSTAKTCPSPQVVCPDGSCQDSNAKCADIYPCRQPSSGPALLRCPDGSCRTSLVDCPTGVTCPVGQLLCENGRCASRLSDCAQAIKAPIDRIRCSDGSIVNNIEHCPSMTTCPPHRPVLCSNGACVDQIGSCTTNSPCPAQYVTCPDGSCVYSPDGSTQVVCPKNTACPRDAPVLCQDGSCVSSVLLCEDVSACPINLPSRCPDGSCRGNLADCPSRTVCPNPAFPVLCPDQSCRASVDLCIAIVCPKGYQRCPGGECAQALALCPTHVTCPVQTSRCQDGSCRTNCGNTTAPQTCSGALPVSCPHVGAGVVCARTLAECPTDVVCPRSTPVRCLDATCAATLADCPAHPGDKIYQEASPCPDGSWTTGGLASCPTPVSCPSNAPYKCVDNTCRMSPEDCPLVTKCTTPDRPYRCPNGRCGQNPADPVCASNDPPCRPDQPIRCPTGDRCVNQLSECDPIFTGQAPTSKNTLQDSTTINTGEGCPSGKVRCRDGSCVLTAEICKSTPPPCPPERQCPNGLCVTNAATDCQPLPSDGCYEPNQRRCPSTGRCVFNLAACPDLDADVPAQCPSGAPPCPDGSCSPDGDCPLSNGCRNGEYRCLDGTCVKPENGGDPNARCIQPDLSTTAPNGNVCPFYRPYRCEDGLCAVSSTACPAPLNDYKCDGTDDKSFTCSDGQCVQSSDRCSIVKPCSVLEERCGDGTCRPRGRCPRANTCPRVRQLNGSIVKYVRCPTGQCAPTRNDCPEYGSTEDLQGCYRGQFKCFNGACTSANTQRPGTNAGTDTGSGTVPPIIITPTNTPNNGNNNATAAGNATTTTSAPTTVAPTTVAPTTVAPTSSPNVNISDPSERCDALFGQFPAANGCPKSAEFKCFNGECVADLARCKTPDGCPPEKPFFCQLAGICSATPSCPSTPCTGILCADGICLPAGSERSCVAANSCPATSPVRCANGACKEFPASFNRDLQSRSCSIVPTCNDGDVPCYDGSCRPTAALCPPTQVCDGGFQRCPDDTCQPVGKCPLGCPAGAPVLCDSGACRESPAECGRGGSIGSVTGGGGTLGGGSSGSVFITPAPGRGTAASGSVPSSLCTNPSRPYECFDGSCRSGPLECQHWAAKVRGRSVESEFVSGRLTGTSPNPCSDPAASQWCANGQCVSDLSLCPVIAACPLEFIRCPDGSCTNTTCPDGNYINGVPVPCTNGNFRCQDGSCRPSCRQLQYDGCPHTTAPYHCRTRECAMDAGSCPPPSRHGSPFVYSPTKKFGVGRRLFQTSSAVDSNDFPLSPCYTNCRASVKAASRFFSISSSNSYSLNIAIDNNQVPQARLEIPTGAFGKSALTQLQIIPVGESRMRDAENFVDSTRRSEFGSYMTMVETVLSVAFECRSGNVSVSPTAAILYKASIDQTYLRDLSDQSPRLRDICLGQLFQIPDIGFTAWRCVLNAAQRSADPTNVRPNSADPPHLLTGTIPTCSPIATASNGELIYPIYAFIHQPVRNPNLDDGPSWVKRNLLTLLLILVGIVVFLAFLIYAINRLHRYRGKYHEERAAVQKQQEEVDEMEQFGGHAGVKDDEVEMMSNPMVIQMKDMQAQLDAKNQEMRLAEAQARAQQSAVRQDHIMNLQHDRDALAMELERLRQELAAQNAAAAGGAGQRRPMPQMTSHTSLIPAHPSMIAHEEPQHTDFQAARPKRRGKDF